MMKRSVFYLLVALTFGTYNYSLGQDNNVKIDFSADVMSRYVWRGTQFGGNTPSLQPAMTMTWKGIEVGAWAAYSLSGSNTGQELDLYLKYTLPNEKFSFTLTDYYFPTEGNDYNYYEFNNDKTGHVIEGMISFNGTEKIPFGLTFAVNFWGADATKLGDNPSHVDFNQKTGLQYSSYLELTYSHTMKNNVSLNAFVGANLTTAKKVNSQTGFQGETGYYGSNSGIVNLGFTLSKEVTINEQISLPVSASLITNPVDEKVYLVFGFSF
jgi:hypothetical protein